MRVPPTALSVVSRAVAALVAMLAVLATPGTAGAQQTGAQQGSDLPQGADTTATYLADGVIHSDGVATPLPADMIRPGGRFELLGQTPRGWAVVERSGNPDDEVQLVEVYLVAPTGASLIHTYGELWGFPDYALGPKGRRILESARYDENTDLSVFGLDGIPVGRNFANLRRVLDFDGRRLLFSTPYTTRLWRLGSSTKRVVATWEGFFGDLSSGALMLDRHRADHTLDWTSLARPNSTRWRANVVPVELNDTGKRFVGRHANDVVQIRRVSDGKLLQAFHASDMGATVSIDVSHLVWEDTDTVLFTAYDPEGVYLVRCGVGGHCRVASPRYGAISLPGLRSFP
jgi:hypothetical protein